MSRSACHVGQVLTDIYHVGFFTRILLPTSNLSLGKNLGESDHPEKIRA